MFHATIVRRGHNPPIEKGTFVKPAWEGNVMLYADLEEEKRNEHEATLSFEKRVMMKDAGVGIVIDHRWYVSPLEFTRVRIDPVYDSHKNVPHVIDVTEDMWYCVAFKKWLFWLRYNWVEIVDQPPT